MYIKVIFGTISIYSFGKKIDTNWFYWNFFNDLCVCVCEVLSSRFWLMAILWVNDLQNVHSFAQVLRTSCQVFLFSCCLQPRLALTHFAQNVAIWVWNTLIYYHILCPRGAFQGHKCMLLLHLCWPFCNFWFNSLNFIWCNWSSSRLRSVVFPPQLFFIPFFFFLNS